MAVEIARRSQITRHLIGFAISLSSEAVIRIGLENKLDKHITLGGDQSGPAITGAWLPTIEAKVVTQPSFKVGYNIQQAFACF